MAGVTGMPENLALGALESLADAHLVQAAEFGRYRYHPLIKLYAWRKALAEGDHSNCVDAGRRLAAVDQRLALRNGGLSGHVLQFCGPAGLDAELRGGGQLLAPALGSPPVQVGPAD